MFYGIVTQHTAEYTERQLRAYPLPSQRTQDGAKPVPASRLSPALHRQLRNNGCASVHAGGVVITRITEDQANALASN